MLLHNSSIPSFAGYVILILLMGYLDVSNAYSNIRLANNESFVFEITGRIKGNARRGEVMVYRHVENQLDSDVPLFIAIRPRAGVGGSRVYHSHRKGGIWSSEKRIKIWQLDPDAQMNVKISLADNLFRVWINGRHIIAIEQLDYVGDEPMIKADHFEELVITNIGKTTTAFQQA